MSAVSVSTARPAPAQVKRTRSENKKVETLPKKRSTTPRLRCSCDPTLSAFVFLS